MTREIVVLRTFEIRVGGQVRTFSLLDARDAEALLRLVAVAKEAGKR